MKVLYNGVDTGSRKC